MSKKNKAKKQYRWYMTQTTWKKRLKKDSKRAFRATERSLTQRILSNQTPGEILELQDSLPQNHKETSDPWDYD